MRLTSQSQSSYNGCRQRCCAPLISVYSVLLLLTAVVGVAHSSFTQSSRESVARQRWALSSSSESCALSEVSSRQVAVLDGAELASLESFLLDEGAPPLPQSRRGGFFTVLAGTAIDDARRVVGIQIPPHGSSSVYSRSVAKIPDSVSDADAISTLVASLAAVHCAVPRVHDVGGDSGFPGYIDGHVVVLGGGDYACFAADALATLGAQVSLVTTGKPRPKNINVRVMEPAIGKLQIGFSTILGQFDSLVDTIGDEMGETPSGMQHTTGVVAELRRQHKCHRYISTFSHSQKIVRDEGLLFGPKKADSYTRDIANRVSNNNNNKSSLFPLTPPKHFGSSTVEPLLSKGILFPRKKGMLLRGWSLKDFWELTSWPRDSAGGANVRFGLPVIDDLESMFTDDDEEERNETTFAPNIENKHAVVAPVVDDSSLVLNIRGLADLNDHVLSAKKDCILFLTAPYCRTCKYIVPQFARLARASKETHNNDNNKYCNVTYAKADAVGKLGKDLGRALNVVSVPTFVLFKAGELYGEQISVTRLPSKKINLALEYLVTGVKWDRFAFRDEEQSESNS